MLIDYIAECSNVTSLQDIMNFGSGFAFKSETYNANGLYKILTIKNVHDGDVDCSSSNKVNELPPKMKEYCKLELGDVVLSLTGNVGRVGIVAEDNCLLNQRVAVFQPIKKTMLPGLYFFFRYKPFQNKMINIARGTAQMNLSPIETLQLEIPYNTELFETLCLNAKPVFDLILSNKIESRKLSLLRDSLLPKLMSDEIDVSKVVVELSS